MLSFRLLIVWIVLLWGGSGLSLSQARHPLVESARIGSDHGVYLRWTGQMERAQRQGEAQTGSSDLRVSPDRTAAAWLVERTDISDASYPESVELLVASAGGRPHGIFPGHVISSWQFESGGRRIALYDNTAHGNLAGAALLYSSATGRILARWQPDSKTAPPRWAAPLHAEWDNDVP